MGNAAMDQNANLPMELSKFLPKNLKMRSINPSFANPSQRKVSACMAADVCSSMKIELWRRSLPSGIFIF